MIYRRDCYMYADIHCSVEVPRSTSSTAELEFFFTRSWKVSHIIAVAVANKLFMVVLLLLFYYSGQRLYTLYFQESAQDSFVFTVVFCTLSFINLIRVAYVVWRPCSDFTDMLRCLIHCRIIIIIIIIIINIFIFLDNFSRLSVDLNR